MGGRLDGKVAIITGGARGQGAGHARRLPEEGAHVLTADVLDAEDEATAATLRADGLAVLLGMQAAIPALRARGGGSIVNISSVFGLAGASGYVGYGASKAAVVMMTKTAALEHAADNIRVNAVCPGGVRTAMNENEVGGGVVPLTRWADVREITGTVLFLAGDDSTFVTGTEIVVDGGYLAR
jgi:NAD(P)-dependent dehydrogenase (short-subunit alcohol dehydrogenase family)